jgi:hypothetical protein
MRAFPLVLGGLVAISASTLAAQTVPASPNTNTKYIHLDYHIHPDMAQEFEGALKKYCAAIVKGGGKLCTVYSVQVFGDHSEYLMRMPLDDYAHFDGPLFSDKGSTPAEIKAIHATLDKCTITLEESTVLLINGLSILNPSQGSLYHVVRVQLKPGSAQNFYDDISKLQLPAAKTAGLTDFYVYKTQQGASPDTMFVVTRLSSFADLDKPNPIFKAMSKEDYATFLQHTAAYSEMVTYSVFKYRPELSTVPVEK